MKLLWLMLLVISIEYTFGAETTTLTLTGGNEVKIRLVDYNIFPDNLGTANLSQPNLTADDMLKTISALDKTYDYAVYKAFNDQFIVVALLKGESDTILDMQYMNITNIQIWYNDKMNETLGWEDEPNV